MDIDKYLQPEYDFSRLMPEELGWLDNATEEEIIYVLKNPRTVWNPQPGYPISYNRWYAVGFSYRSRCFDVIITLNEEHKHTLLLVNLTDEYGIELSWCRKQGRIL